ncbi:hypothetical protein, partial [uncultured Alistipes sp.]|uniref:hypothetical protein n=1 Tax=uncultured Alistipes sp. TaxID=538949 RepID=UPI00272D5CFE
GSQNSLRRLRHENNSHTTIKTNNCLRITKPQNEKNRRKKNARQNKQFLIPTAPLRRQRTAESTQTTLTEAVAPVTPGVKLLERR